jgi:2-dehydropantoate 2-reductase
LRIIVFGAGAIGGLVGAHLAARHDVTLVCRKENADAVNANGLRVTGLSDILARPKAITSARGRAPPDILFFTVKAYDTAAAVADARELGGPGTLVVSLQNGLGNLEAIVEALPGAKVVAGVTSHGAFVREPGVIEHTGRSYTLVGGPGADTVANALSECGIRTDISADMAEEIWYKAIVNSAINPIATLMRSPNGVLVEEPRLVEFAMRLVAEAVEVAQAGGIDLDAETAREKVMTVARETANNRCSMLQDIERGRRTEIMQLNGEISERGRLAGVATPLNDLLTTLVRAMEKA